MGTCELSIAFVSNYYNHHQKYLSDALYALTGGKYCFIETARMGDERLGMGWGSEEKPAYVKQTYLSEAAAGECRKIIDDADVVIIGSAPNALVKGRLGGGKLVFRYSERMLKRREPWKYPYRWLKWHMRSCGKGSTYMLCASAYTAADCAKFGLFHDRCYKWGYFPEVRQYEDIDRLVEWKHPASILWVARLIEWKHPELPVLVAKCLKEEGYRFDLSIIGNGVMEDELRELIKTNCLEDRVHMLGTMKPEEVRAHMEKSEIFLFTSDRNEGWGAVLNEAMNSGCAVVASHAIGSVPYLIEDGVNGLIYRDGDFAELCEKTKWLLDHAAERKTMARNAYWTMANEWNAENAARRLLALATELLRGTSHPTISPTGVCSKAEVLKDDWYEKQDS